RLWALPQGAASGGVHEGAGQKKTFEILIRMAPGAGPIAVVSHGGVGALLLCHLTGVPISRTAEQPGASGGNYFLFSMPKGILVHGWKPMEAYACGTGVR